jgi:hypothetical protein
MCVIHPDRRVLGGELIEEGLTSRDRILGEGSHAIHVVWCVDPVPVNIRAHRRQVGELDLHVVTDVDLDLRARDLAVVSPGVDDLTR